MAAKPFDRPVEFAEGRQNGRIEPSLRSGHDPPLQKLLVGPATESRRVSKRAGRTKTPENRRLAAVFKPVTQGNFSQKGSTPACAASWGTGVPITGPTDCAERVPERFAGVDGEKRSFPLEPSASQKVGGKGSMNKAGTSLWLKFEENIWENREIFGRIRKN